MTEKQKCKSAPGESSVTKAREMTPAAKGGEAARSQLVPEVNRGKCEGKSDCARVCPYDVFEVRRIDDADFRALGFMARLKVRAHGMKSAYTPRADACQACGECVAACPEKAIKLVRRAR